MAKRGGFPGGRDFSHQAPYLSPSPGAEIPGQGAGGGKIYPAPAGWTGGFRRWVDLVPSIVQAQPFLQEAACNRDLSI